MDKEAARIERIKSPPSIGDFCRFVDQDELVKLGYVQNLTKFSGTIWRVIGKTPSYYVCHKNYIQNYFDLENEQGVVLSSIPDEILIKVEE